MWNFIPRLLGAAKGLSDRFLPTLIATIVLLAGQWWFGEHMFAKGQASREAYYQKLDETMKANSAETRLILATQLSGIRDEMASKATRTETIHSQTAQTIVREIAANPKMIEPSLGASPEMVDAINLTRKESEK